MLSLSLLLRRTMLRLLRPLASLCAAGALLLAAAPSVSATQMTTACDLSALRLSGGLTFHDTAGAGFSPDQHSYQCNCGSAITQTQIAIDSTSEERDTATFELNYTPASGTPVHQYLNLAQPSQSLQLAAGTNTFSVSISVPSTCTATYTVDCQKSSDSGGFVVGDPQFTGLRGQQFQIHGVAGEVYNIISSAQFNCQWRKRHMQEWGGGEWHARSVAHSVLFSVIAVNSRFVFLEKGSCPILHGRRAHGCWSHPGSYLGEIGIKTSNGDEVRIQSGHAREGFERVAINDRPLPVGATVELPSPDSDLPAGRITFNSTHVVSVHVGAFLIEFENSDLFVNQRVRVMDWSQLKDAHGLLGQTWKGKVYNHGRSGSTGPGWMRDAAGGTGLRYIEGSIDDYLVRGRDIFGQEFFFNKFRDLTVG